MEIKRKQPIPLQSQPNPNPKQNVSNAHLKHVSASSKSFSFLSPESTLVYYPFIALLSAEVQLIANQIIKSVQS